MRAINLDMLKVRGSNTVEVGIGVKAAIERLKKDLPGDIELTILSDRSEVREGQRRWRQTHHHWWRAAR